MLKISQAPFIAATLVLAAASPSLAQDFYGVGALSYGVQANDSGPYGNNLALDSNFPQDFDSGDGIGGAIGIGYVINDQFRIEGRLGVHNAEFDETLDGLGGDRAGQTFQLDGELKSTTLTIEAFYDIATASAIKPYVKAGVGVSRNTYSAKLGGTGVGAFAGPDGFYDEYADETSNEFSWTVGAGASYAIDESTVLFGEYQYVSLGDASTGQDAFTDGFEVDAAAHEILVGLRVSF